MNSEHFKAAIDTMSELVTEVPEIINVEVPGDDWSRMAEVTPRNRCNRSGRSPASGTSVHR